MDAYIFMAELYCEDCANKIKDANEDVAAAIALRGGSVANERTYDSDEYPKGPFDDGGGESDTPSYCGSCGVFLRNPLTREGYAYVLEAIREELNETTEQWLDYYGDDVIWVGGTTIKNILEGSEE